jgi:DNA-binding PadR family transcriptional regulator
MSIKHAILGFLSWTPLTGYDLKKKFAESDILYWSGNNNQIYRALVELHQDDWVTQEIQHQASGPSRKVYTITEKGLAELRQWLLSAPELPQLRNSFLVQLAWADQLEAHELDVLLAAYEDELRVKLLMLHEQNKRDRATPHRTPREAYLWDMITQNILSFYEHQLNWVRQLRNELSDGG